MWRSNNNKLHLNAIQLLFCKCIAPTYLSVEADVTCSFLHTENGHHSGLHPVTMVIFPPCQIAFVDVHLHSGATERTTEYFVWHDHFTHFTWHSELIYTDLCYQSLNWCTYVCFCRSYVTDEHNRRFKVLLDDGLIDDKWRAVENLYTTRTLQYLTSGKKWNTCIYIYEQQ